MLLRELEPELYWSFPNSYSKDKRELEISRMMQDGKHYYQEKTDGNYSAFICDFDGDKRIISRGTSTKTKEYGRIEDRLFFFESVAKVFDKPTRIMGEVYYDHGIDRNVGSVLRANVEKSLSIQDNDYYEAAKKVIKFSAKDRRDIESNEFRGKKLKWRIFDVWFYDGIDLMSTPWIERQVYVRMAAERINDPLVSYVPYYPMNENFYDAIGEIFQHGGEGVVAYLDSGKPEPGKRTAHKTLKIKTEIENLIDAFIIGLDPAVHDYTGKDIGNWHYWENTRTGEKLLGEYFGDYQNGKPVKPISKGYYYGWPGAIIVGVYDKNNNIIPLCKVSGLTEDFKDSLRDDFNKWYLCPVAIAGMAISEAQGLSVRHPRLHSIRKGDIDPKDCTLAKLIEENY